MDFADKIKFLREEFLNLSRVDLAKKLNISRTSIYNWEIGVSKPSLENIKAISLLCGISTDYLMKENYPLELSLFKIDNKGYDILDNLIKYLEERNQVKNKNENKIYNYLVNNNIYLEKDVFEYGFEYFLSYLVYLLIVIPISILTDSFIEIMLFIILYIPIRKNIGGLHLKKRYHCLMLSIIITLVVPILTNYIFLNIYLLLIPIILNTFLYIMFVPVDCKEKKLSQVEIKYYKIKSLILHLIYFTLYTFTFLYNIDFVFQVLCIIEIISSFSIITSKIKVYI